MKTELKQIVNRIDTLPPVSPHTIRIMRLASDPDYRIQDLAELVTLDLTLSAACLRMVNSASFGLRRPITTIAQAVAYLGSREVLSLAVTGGFQGVLDAPLAGYGAESGDLWAHSLRTAIASARVAELIFPREQADVIYTAGLLHDIGKAVLSEFLSVRVEAVREGILDEHPADFTSLERNLLNLDHTEAGEMLADRWKLPESIREVIRYHHTPGIAPQPVRNLCLAVHLGDILAMLGGTGTGFDTLTYHIDPLAAEVLKHHDDRMAKLMLDIDSEFTRAQEKMRAISGEKDD